MPASDVSPRRRSLNPSSGKASTVVAFLVVATGATAASAEAASPTDGDTSVSIGFQATHTGTTAESTSFSLNGAACAVA